VFRQAFGKAQAQGAAPPVVLIEKVEITGNTVNNYFDSESGKQDKKAYHSRSAMGQEPYASASASRESTAETAATTDPHESTHILPYASSKQ
jgi:hypothetical protein